MLLLLVHFGRLTALCLLLLPGVRRRHLPHHLADLFLDLPFFVFVVRIWEWLLERRVLAGAHPLLDNEGLRTVAIFVHGFSYRTLRLFRQRLLRLDLFGSGGRLFGLGRGGGGGWGGFLFDRDGRDTAGHLET